MWDQLTLILCLTISCVCFADADVKCELQHNGNNKQFPKEFSFGVSTAAYQIEGAWNEDGKGPSIWDNYTHMHPERIADHSNGDSAAESYHRFGQDLVALKELKVRFYRFSISWSRLLPKTDTTEKNQKAIDYYNMVIDKLLENNIEPMVTMFHYDMPDGLMKFGGFTNDIVIKYFRFYADILFETFGDRVKKWITFNEPFDYCLPGYGSAYFPPMIHAPGVADYICMDNLLKAHASAYRLYKAKYFHSQRGKVGITISSRFYYPKTNDAEDVVDRGLQYSLGWLAHPIFGKSGNYPYKVIEDITSNSMKEGLAWSRLRPFNFYWSKIIKGSGDFLGLNYYTSRYVEIADPPLGENPSWERDSRLKYSVDKNWKRAKSNWLFCAPKGLEDLLKWIRDNYNNVEVYITENGWSDNGELNDADRIDYLKAHLQAVLNAVNDGCKVTHYSHWSLIDNFEWNMGFTEKFGLYYVNMTSKNKERVAKNSAHYYRSVIESRKISSSDNFV
ncbi:myrosinase 1-like [Anastrepha ludens]|uniref:myrosinase 1-like n=1 Tax=Anastrepha ludens TaxID=28586 RepID=UPI0023AF36EC|nr:myrosinase 1-like [Anastrepha ludens]